MVTAVQWSALGSYRLSNSALAVTVVPKFGGKIVQITHTKGGRDWLWQNPWLGASLPEYGASYVEGFDLGGWDECFPAVAPGRYPYPPWQGQGIPDHGELWCVPWHVAEAEPDLLDLVGVGLRFPILARRLLRLTDCGLAIHYRLENTSNCPFPFLWCAHPLLNVAPGARLIIPGNLPWRVWRDQGFDEVRAEPVLTMPGPDAAVAVKYFAAAPATGEVAVDDREGRFRLLFDRRIVTHIGIWINACGWSGVPGAKPYYNLGLEPAIGAGDRLTPRSVESGDAGVIPAKGKIEWTLELQLEA